MSKKSEMKRTGANAERKREQSREKIRTHVPSVKPGRLILILAIFIFGGYKAVQFVRSGKIGKAVAPMVASEGVLIRGTITVDSAFVARVATDSVMTISPKATLAAVKRVREIPGIASARPGITFSKQRAIVVKEQKPTAFVVFRGELHFMSSDGKIWPFKAGSYWDFPVLTGVTCLSYDNGSRKISDEDMRRYRSIMDTFRGPKSPRPVGLDFSNPDRIAVRFNGITPTIRFGNSPEKRLENLNGILEIVRRDDVEVRHYIDLSYKNVAFIR